ncbi:MAG: hypothetical protein LBG06_00970 [Deltaproteobacteria bacterium]|nr:hypothetical protein [Deltaproteobacteria bacterium]
MSSRLILHDLYPDTAEQLISQEASGTTVIAALPGALACRGCFGCWVRTPGVCVLRDDFRGFPALITAHDEFAVVSRLVWGGFSPAVKRVLDRSLAHLLPFFVMRDGEMRHVNRNPRPFRFTAVLYGAGSDQESLRLAEKTLAANAANIGAASWEARFLAGAPEAPLL